MFSLTSIVSACGLKWKQRMYPITQGLLPVSVLVWGEKDNLWFGEITKMTYTYVFLC